MQASNCDRCFRRKGRCDKLQPCGSCARANVTCSYTDKVRQRRFTADDIERVEKKLRQAEARNRSLAEELSKVQNGHAGHVPEGISSAATERSQVTERARRADAVSEVSYLSINAADERQPYLGSTSGVLFADLVRSSVDASVSRQASPPSARGTAEQAAIGRPPSSPTLPRSTHDLPCEEVARKLLKAYFEHDAISNPFILPSTLLQTADRVYREEHYYTMEASSFTVLVFNIVLAIATASVYKYDWQMLPSAESHHARAMQELSAVLASGGLQCLQAILLLCQYRAGSSIRDTSASTWHLVGIAARICLELGLHRESVYSIAYSPRLEPVKLESYWSQEIARKCFWCLIGMDRVTSNILGRPLAIRDEDIDTLMPSDESDVVLSYPLPPDLLGIPRISIFKAIIEYRLLTGRTLSTLHRRRGPNVSAEAALRARDDLAEQLEQWQSGVQQLNLPDEIALGSCFLSPIWFQVLYANAKLMIWRPCPLLADVDQEPLALQNIHDSSIMSINAYASLHKSRKINYSWVTLQSVFMAGLSFLYSVSRHLRHRLNPSSVPATGLLEKDPATIDISQTSRACSKVMVAVAERWNALRHCHEVFDRLSDAVLADAIKLSSVPRAPAIPDETPQCSTSPYPNLQTPSSTPYNIPAAAGTPNIMGAPYWSSLAQQPQPGPAGVLAVDSEFYHSFDELQNMYFHQVDDPLSHLSNAWASSLDGMFEGGGLGMQDGVFGAG